MLKSERKESGVYTNQQPITYARWLEIDLKSLKEGLVHVLEVDEKFI